MSLGEIVVPNSPCCGNPSCPTLSSTVDLNVKQFSIIFPRKIMKQIPLLFCFSNFRTIICGYLSEGCEQVKVGRLTRYIPAGKKPQSFQLGILEALEDKTTGRPERLPGRWVVVYSNQVWAGQQSCKGTALLVSTVGWPTEIKWSTSASTSTLTSCLSLKTKEYKNFSPHFNWYI